MSEAKIEIDNFIKQFPEFQNAYWYVDIIDTITGKVKDNVIY